MSGARPGPAARLLLLLLRLYRQGVSPLLGPRCRFAPTCSAYAVEAVTLHGAPRGSLLAAGRIVRCHPFHPGGHDPVPVSGRRSPRRTAPPSATMAGAASATMDTDRGARTSTRPAPRRRTTRPGPGG